jgi:hypothetical protein
MELSEFRKKVVKAEEKKHHFKVTNSNGTKEAWRWIKKHKWLDIGQPITEYQLGQIIKAINNTLRDQLLDGKDVSFPNRMGRLEIRKFKAKVECKEGKVVTTLPVDWKRTIDLWWEDDESRESKTLVRFEGLERFAIYYNKKYANFVNKSFYRFIPIRALKRELKEKIINEGFDALLLGKHNELH